MERESSEQDEADEAREQEALGRSPREGLLGDTEENHNLTGSTTWETLPDQGPAPDDATDLPGRG